MVNNIYTVITLYKPGGGVTYVITDSGNDHLPIEFDYYEHAEDFAYLMNQARSDRLS